MKRNILTLLLPLLLLLAVPARAQQTAPRPSPSDAPGLDNVAVSTTAGLGAPGSPGRLRKLTDGNRGIVVDTGRQWVSLTGNVFNVRLFNAAGDGRADDTQAINAAIAALNSAGRGVLYFPAGAYRITGALDDIKAFSIIRGEGNSTIPYGGAFSTAVLCASPTGKAFTVSAYYAKFENLVIANTASSTPTAGAGVEVSSTTSNNRVDFDSVHVERFYIGVDVRTGGGAWSIRNSNFFDTVLYHVRVNNVLNPDSGDWSISDCRFWQQTRPADTAIRTEGSGGGKIINCKFNGAGDNVNQFKHCIDARPQASSVLLITNCSFENYGGASGGIGIVTQLALTNISNCQFGVYNPRSYAIFAGNTQDVVIDAVTVAGAGQGSAAVVLDNLQNGEVGQLVVRSFGGRVQVNGKYSGALIPGEPTDGPLAITSNTVTPYFTVNHVGAGHIRTITVPDPKRAQTTCFTPDAPFTWDSSSNIAAGGTGTAAVGRTLCFTWSPSANKWYSSY